MSDIIRAFCVVACLISGIYAGIISYYFRNAKRMIWFAALCFAFCVNINMHIACYPLSIFDSDYISSNSDNIYFTVYSVLALCLYNYAGLINRDKTPKMHNLFSYLSLFFACISLFIPPSLSVFMYIVLTVFVIISLVYSMHFSLWRAKGGEKEYYYSVAAYSLLFVAVLADFCIAMFKLRAVSFRVLATPVFIGLHAGMLSSHYIVSLNKTKILSVSLSETIEKINHSDNALMCTQMKSDFLYKSLDLISQRCDENPFSAEDLTVSLSKYLRHTLNFQQLQGIVPLNNEIELTNAFIAIEKERNPKLSFEYKFPNPLPEFHIPPLSIQPLVENAIEHAFSPTQENPKITITIIPYRDYYHIDVSDNGEGMEEDVANSLTDSLHDSARVGVYSIHTRLINLFGKGLVIQSAPGVGTSVSFVVPPDATSYINDSKEEKS